jgi:hypothetical protein
VIGVRTADLNGNGIPDLCGLHVDKGGTARLCAARGWPPELWRRPGIWRPAAERPGSQSNDNPKLVPYIAPPLPHGDLDGDGIPDVLIFRPFRPAGADTERASLRACSGQSGRRLWQVEAADLGLGRDDEITQLFGLECRDLEGKGRPAVVFSFRCTVQRDRLGSGHSRYEGQIAVLDGRSGKVRWSVHPDSWALCALADVNGDGVLDVVVPPLKDGRDVGYSAYDGRTGRRLTELSLPARDFLYNYPLVDGTGGYLWLGYPPIPNWRFNNASYDLNGDGIPDRLSVGDGRLQARSGPRGEFLWQCPLSGVELRAIRPASSGGPAVVVVQSPDGRLFGLDGVTGRPRWRCEGPGRPAYLLFGTGPDDLPAVVFHLPQQEITVCLHALPTNPDGSYQRTTDRLPSDGAATEARLWTVPYPWEYRAKQRLPQALGLGLVYLAALVGATVMRRWGTLLVLGGCLLVLPFLVTLGEFGDVRLAVGETYTLGGWWLRWPYALTTWKGWGGLGNPCAWMAVWFAGLGVWRVLR